MSDPSPEGDAPETGRYLSFFMGKEEFAIPLQSVKEVVALPPITPIPHSAAYFLGVMNLRGQVISIIDLRKKLNLKSEVSSETTVILSDIGGACIGYVVDSVSSVIAAGNSEISAPPNQDQSKFICGVLKNKTNLVLLLDLPVLFDAVDRSAVAAVAKKSA